MKTVVLILFTFISTSSYARYIDIVFDIDWTLVYPVNDLSEITNTSRLYHVNGEYYRLADGAEEIIDDLIKNKNVRISFFSGGLEKRNIDLLKSIMLPNSNKSLYEISHKVLSKKDLSVVSDDHNLKFFQRYKKDLRLVNNDLKNVVLIDDLKEFTLAGQGKNVMWLEETFEFTEKFKQGYSSKFYPANKLLWAKERSKLFWIFDQLDYAIKKSTAEGTSFVDEVVKYRERTITPEGLMRKAFVRQDQLAAKYKKLSKVKFKQSCFIWF